MTHALPERLSDKQPSWPPVSILLLLVASVFLPSGLLTGMNAYLLLLAAIAWFYSSTKFDSQLLRAIAPFLLIIASGLCLGIYADTYLYLKDAWYVANPAIILCTGSVFYRCRPQLASGLRAFVLGGTLVAGFYLSAFVVQPELITQSSVKIRETIGTGFYAPALALTLLLAYFTQSRDGLLLPVWLARTCLLLCALACALCFSRTMLLVVGIGIAAVWGFFSRNEWGRLLAIATVGLASLSLLGLAVDTGSREVQHSFMGKLSRSISEITVEEYTDFKSINENWRGYETARALKLYYAGNPLQWLLGYGFGQQVDLGLAMPLGAAGDEGSVKRYIPILHNGYAYLLVKGGAVAVLLFLSSLLFLYRVGRRAAHDASSDMTHRNRAAAARVLQSVAATLAATTWLVSGAFNKLDMFPFLLAAGFILAALTHTAPQRHPT